MSKSVFARQLFGFSLGGNLHFSIRGCFDCYSNKYQHNTEDDQRSDASEI